MSVEAVGWRAMVYGDSGLGVIDGEDSAEAAPILLISQRDLLAADVWGHAAEVVDLVARVLGTPGAGRHGKVVLAPSNIETARLLDLDSETVGEYRGLDFDYKLNVLAALGPAVAGFKAVGANVLNQRLGLPRADALFVLYDPVTMRPRTIIRSSLLSALRTAAYADIVRRRCRARVVTVLGTGEIGRATVRLFSRTGQDELDEVRVYSPHLGAGLFRSGIGHTPFRLITSGSAEEAVAGTDLLVTATTAARPVFDLAWVDPDVVHVNLGGYEAPPAFLDRCAEVGTIIVDDLQGGLRRGVQSLAWWWTDHATPTTSARIATFAARDWDVLPRPWHVNCVGRADLDIAVAAWAEALAQRGGQRDVICL